MGVVDRKGKGTLRGTQEESMLRPPYPPVLRTFRRITANTFKLLRARGKGKQALEIKRAH
jgi:hypothetical protein